MARRTLLVLASVALAVPATAAFVAMAPTSPAEAAYEPGVLIDGGAEHTCAVTEAGGVRCWGFNAFGGVGDGTTEARTAPVDVVGLSGVLSVSVDEGRACALKLDGTVSCWGDGMGAEVPNSTTPTEVVGLPTMVKIDGSCGVAADETAWCWSDYRNPAPVPGLSGVTSISHNCAVITGGAVRCWGANQFGQLGNGTTTASATPVEPTGLSSGYVEVVSSRYTVCARSSVGAIRCWGLNAYGQVGNTTTTNRTTPTGIGGLSGRVTSMSLATDHTCVTRNNGLVNCWGRNQYGQLGTGTTTNLAAPGLAVLGISNAVRVGIGTFHSCAVLATGEARCWGQDESGALGDGAATVPAGSTATVSGGNVFSAGIGVAAPGAPTDVTVVGGQRSATVSWTAPSEDGVSPITGYAVTPIRDGVTQASVVFPWSTATSQVVHGIDPGVPYTFRVAAISDVGTGALSAPSAAGTSIPKPGLDNRTVVGSTDLGGCVVLATGGLNCWSGGSVPAPASGFSGVVQMGQGSYEVCALTTSQRIRCRSLNSGASGLIPGLTDATWLALGRSHGCAVRSGGTVVCWGRNAEGQLGDGTTTSAPTTAPVTVAGITDAVEVTAGDLHTCARSSDGTVRCWGVNTYGQLGNGTTTTSLTPVPVTGLSGTTALAAGANHTCALTAAGAPTCWGRNNGSLGNGLTANSSTPVVTSGGITGATSIAAAYRGTCVVTGGGAVRCWGLDYAGDGASVKRLTPTQPTGLGGRVDHVGSGSGGASYCAILETGEMRCWGWGETGAVPAGSGEFFTPVTISGGSIYYGAPTVPALPGAPTIDSVTSPAPGEVTVTWSPPDADGGAAVTGYVITPYRGGVAQDPIAHELPDRTYTLEDPAGGSYAFRVAAVNAVGTGTVSALGGPVVVAPASVPPGAPTIGTATPGVAEAIVTWTAPVDDGGSPITGYLVTPYVPGGTRPPILFDASTTTRTITGLSNDAQYSFRVQAINARGTGALSSQSNWVVPCRCIWGRLLTDGTDAPVANARVRGQLDGIVYGEAYTDSNGWYRMRMNTSVPVAVQYADPRTSPQRFPVQHHTASGVESPSASGATLVAAGRAGLVDHLAIPERLPITGTVVDGLTGDPVQGLRVTAGRNGVIYALGYTQADGTFTLNRLIEGTSYEIVVADTRVGASPSYRVRWYSNSPNRAGATLVLAGSDITFVATRR